MSLLRFIIGTVIVIFGLLAAALVMVLGLFAYFVQRLLGKTGRRPVFQYQASFKRGPASARRHSAPASDDVIDVDVIDVATTRITDSTDAKH